MAKGIDLQQPDGLFTLETLTSAVAQVWKQRA
jgi:hypothetical protein